MKVFLFVNLQQENVFIYSKWSNFDESRKNKVNIFVVCNNNVNMGETSTWSNINDSLRGAGYHRGS